MIVRRPAAVQGHHSQGPAEAVADSCRLVNEPQNDAWPGVSGLWVIRPTSVVGYRAHENLSGSGQPVATGQTWRDGCPATLITRELHRLIPAHGGENRGHRRVGGRGAEAGSSPAPCPEAATRLLTPR